MKIHFMALLRCPRTRQTLHLESDQGGEKAHNNEIRTGWLISEDGQHRYPILNGIPRFVEESNYADNFGMQWKQFSKTQLDSYSGHPISAERFWKATGWQPEDMKDQWVLDVGCGAGRFAEVALSSGAQLVALDYSCAVDACYANHMPHPNLHVVQGNIYSLPFMAESFSFVYSLGVLQHTPDVANAFASLPPMLAEEGRLCVDVYWKRFPTIFHIKYLLRPITKRMSKIRLFSILQKNVPRLLLISQFLGRIPLIGRILQRLVPVADYTGKLPLTEEQLNEWALLDTFDMLAPKYDSPQTMGTLKKWFNHSVLDEIKVFYENGLNGPTGTGRKR